MPAQISVTGYTELMKGMRHLPAQTRKEIRAEFKHVGSLVETWAKHNASWSERIPKSITTSVTQTSVAVKARRRLAPHSGTFEFGGRHPVFGQDVWVMQQARPFLRPAAQKSAPLIVPQMDAAMRRAIKKAGL